ncbi:MAG: MiaB/RimO family radical SAM methylthiotransferase [Synergistaceae bacterium]|nr:MiaB/RimO family radical SAM methylthiotransferase [Synergistota bacterium]NLM72306.1 MiaB/RimO family radical SAM methylthiotransferase [Synergistaceae bacterium]
MRRISGRLAGKRVKVATLGCRTNQYEGEAVANSLVNEGAVLAEGPGCDVAVLMSCTVTSVADAKCRRMVRRFRRDNPAALVAVCGCWAQRLDEAEARELGIDILLGNRKKHMLPELLADFPSGGKGLSVIRGDVLECDEWDPLFQCRPLLHTRAFVKVQDGCDQFCSYCLVPYVRGLPVDRAPEDVVEEVRSIVASGCAEVVVTGVHLGLYGRGGTSLADLVRRIASVDGLKRLRFGSLEPPCIDEELLDVLAGTPQFQPHLHIPVQSGSDRVLDLMNRGYSADEYANIVGRARSALGDDIHISTDLLVGFPGEEGNDFEDSLGLLSALRMGKVHVFPFSPREGTRAFDMPGQLPRAEIAARTRRALSLGESLLGEFAASRAGRDVRVLVERAAPSTDQGRRTIEARGLSPCFLRVEGECPDSARVTRGEEFLFAITGYSGGALKGRLIS